MRALRIDGVPVHAALVHFPVAAWTSASFLAVGTVVLGENALGVAALWCNVVGLTTGALAIAAGALEFGELPEDAALRAQAAQHMVMAATAWTLYAMLALLQATDWARTAAVMATAALAILIVAGHAGARIVYHHGFPRDV